MFKIRTNRQPSLDPPPAQGNDEVVLCVPPSIRTVVVVVSFYRLQYNVLSIRGFRYVIICIFSRSHSFLYLACGRGTYGGFRYVNRKILPRVQILVPTC